MVKQDEDDEIASGLVFYAGRIAPRAPGFERFDALGDTIREAHRRGMRVRAWMPQFHDQMAARAHPEWQMHGLKDGRVVPFAGRDRKELFLNPLNTAARDYQRSLIEEVARAYDVDGIVIDWVRFDDYAMDVGDETRARFKASAGFDPIEIDFSADNPRRRQWNTWREAQIADHVRRLRAALDVIKPGLEFGAYILPPEFIEVAQDAAQFSDSVTFLSPMAYHKDWDFPVSWIVQTLQPQTVKKAGATAVIPVFDEDLTDADARAVLPEIRGKWPGTGRSPGSYTANGRALPCSGSIGCCKAPDRCLRSRGHVRCRSSTNLSPAWSPTGKYCGMSRDAHSAGRRCQTIHRPEPLRSTRWQQLGRRF